MALILKINGVDRSNQMDWKSLNWKQNMTDKADIFKFNMQTYGSKTTAPTSLDTVTLERDGTVVFGGVILQVDRVVMAPDRIQHKVTAKDYTHIFDRRLVVERYLDQPIKNIICDIMNRYVNRGDRTEIATFENTEIWTGGTDDTDNYRVGNQARKLTSVSGTTDSMYRDILVNLEQPGFTTSDFIEIDCYVDTAANLDTCTLTLGDADLTNYFSAEVSSQIASDGWNLVSLAQSSFTQTGTLDWEDIARIQIDIKSDASETVNVTFDNWQLVKTTAFRRDDVSDNAPTIDYIAFNYEEPSNALKRMANLFEWNWYIDEDKNVHFFQKFDKSAPFQLTDTNNTYVFRSLKVKDQADQIRNSVYVRGSDYLAPEITDELSHQADGINKIFKLGYKYADYTLEVNGTAVPVGVLNLQDYQDNPSESQIDEGGTSLDLGDAAARERVAQEIVVTNAGRRASFTLRVKKVGSPVDNFQVQVFSDDGSNKPSGTNLSTITSLAGGTITTDFVEYSFDLTESASGDLTFAVGDKFHLVLTRSGAVDGANYYVIDAVAAGAYQGLVHSYDGATWNSESASLYFTSFVDFDALYSFNEKIVVFNSAPADTDVIEWFAKPYLPIIVQYRKITSIDDVGEYQIAVFDPRIKTKLAARQRANQELLAFSETLQDVTYTTYQDGLVVGQTQNIQSTLRGINLDIIIHSVTARANSPEDLVYSVTGNLTRNMDLIYWMQQQIEKDNRQLVIDDDEQLDKIEFLTETFTFAPEYSYTLYVGKFWSNDAGTTPDRLIWDGGADHIWI